jgi:hypothetical protein
MSISKATFDHWMLVEAVEKADAMRGGTAPWQMALEPPSFSACIARLETSTPKSGERQPKPIVAQLKRRCQGLY